MGNTGNSVFQVGLCVPVHIAVQINGQPTDLAVEQAHGLQALGCGDDRRLCEGIAVLTLLQGAQNAADLRGSTVKLCLASRPKEVVQGVPGDFILRNIRIRRQLRQRKGLAHMNRIVGEVQVIDAVCRYPRRADISGLPFFQVILRRTEQHLLPGIQRLPADLSGGQKIGILFGIIGHHNAQIIELALRVQDGLCRLIIQAIRPGRYYENIVLSALLQIIAGLCQIQNRTGLPRCPNGLDMGQGAELIQIGI